MAGKLIVDTIDTDNAFITLNVQQSLIATMNVSGIYSNTGVKMIGANGTVSNTAITGNIISSQITSIGGSQITANTIANSAIQTGAVENYMNAAGLGFGMRNRIINGAMVIDQRNAGAAVTNANAYVLDRWILGNGSTGQVTVQQDSTAPTGFRNSTKVTVTTSDTVSATEYVIFRQKIEGFNVADLMWGTANAQTVTLSFWVRSSLTGTFGGVFSNNSQDRIYPFTYTISSANTFEYKTVTIAGDTTGTWLTTNGTGIDLVFGLGVGSTYSGTAGAWSSSFALSATGATSVVGTNGATWYITGVQLEKGSTATSFDYRSYGNELSLCQRYLPVFNMNTITGAFTGAVGNGMAYSTTAALINYTFKVTPRVPPTGVTVSAASHFSLVLPNTGTSALTGLAFGDANYDSCILSCTGASGLTAGYATFLRNNGASVGQILFTGSEL